MVRQKTRRVKPIVLVHDPGAELFPGMLHPRAALYARYVDGRDLRKEHRNLRDVLSRTGFDVRTVRELILRDTMDDNGDPARGPSLDKLRKFAADFLTFENMTTKEDILVEEYKQSILSEVHPLELFRIITERPTITLHDTDNNTGIAAFYNLRPMMNLMFMRDQMIVTSRGPVLGKLHSPQRLGERMIAGYCLSVLGIDPVASISGEGEYLEGGDFIGGEQVCFLGCGMRTTSRAVEFLLKEKVFGTPKVVIIKDQLHWQPQMHLDTYFNIAGNVAFISENRFYAIPGSESFLKADLYFFNEGNYELQETDIPFTGLLKKEGFEIFPVSMEDSRAFGTNFLEVSSNEIILPCGLSKDYEKKVASLGIKIHKVDIPGFIDAYGAIHCLTQVI